MRKTLVLGSLAAVSIVLLISSSALLAQVQGAIKETPHLKLAVSASEAAVVPGARLSLIVDVTPKPKMHVYAPEQKDYIPIAITVQPSQDLKVWPAVFPKPEKYVFEPLNETQLVFSKPFRIVQDVTIASTDGIRERAAGADAAVTIKGALRYQACDDKICYKPETVPLVWNIALRR